MCKIIENIVTFILAKVKLEKSPQEDVHLWSLCWTGNFILSQKISIGFHFGIDISYHITVLLTISITVLGNLRFTIKRYSHSHFYENFAHEQ